MFIIPILKRYWPYLLALVAVIVLFFAGRAVYHRIYQSGYDDANATWSAKWAERDSLDLASQLAREAAERKKEQGFRNQIEEVNRNAQQQIDQANHDADLADASSSRLRQQAERIAAEAKRQQSACASGRDPTAAGVSQARADYARMLADVLKRADDRAGELAKIADQSRVRGLACEASYDRVAAENNRAQ